MLGAKGWLHLKLGQMTGSLRSLFVQVLWVIVLNAKQLSQNLTQILLVNFEVKMASAHEVRREQLLLHKVYGLVLL